MNIINSCTQDFVTVNKETYLYKKKKKTAFLLQVKNKTPENQSIPQLSPSFQFHVPEEYMIPY